MEISALHVRGVCVCVVCVCVCVVCVCVCVCGVCVCVCVHVCLHVLPASQQVSHQSTLM